MGATMHRWQKSTLVRIGQAKWVSINPLPVIKQETPKYAVFVSETLETQVLTERETLQLFESIKATNKKVSWSKTADQRATR